MEVGDSSKPLLLSGPQFPFSLRGSSLIQSLVFLFSGVTIKNILLVPLSGFY